MRTLFEKNTCPPLHECAEIEYEGKLLEYVKKAWNGKIGRENGLYGLINNESDLRELFKNGHQTYVCYKEKQLKRF